MRLKVLVGIIGLLALGFLAYSFKADQNQTFKGTTVMIESADGIQINADLYESVEMKAPVIIMFHQAGYSRGEYREIAPELVRMGFTCVAIDQRSGKEVNGVTNESFIQAEAAGLSTEYDAAYPDLQNTLEYVKKKYKSRPILIWGSSYSASLTFILAANNPNYVQGILAFSPGEYFTYDGKTIAEYAKLVTCPVFVTSAKSELKEWKEIFMAVRSDDKKSFLPMGEGKHGSKALWKSSKDHAEYWDAVKEFLASIRI